MILHTCVLRCNSYIDSDFASKARNTRTTPCSKYCAGEFRILHWLLYGGAHALFDSLNLRPHPSGSLNLVDLFDDVLGIFPGQSDVPILSQSYLVP